MIFVDIKRPWGQKMTGCCGCCLINNALLEEEMGIQGMGIREKFIATISVLSLLAMIAIGTASYVLSRQSIYAEAKSKGEMLFNYIEASGTFFGKYQKPKIDELVTDPNKFIPELMSLYAIKRMQYDQFAKTQPGYRFKQATLDPLWPDNKADAEEQKIIKYFASNLSAKETEGVMEKEGEQLFYIAKPIRIGKDFCLECHGDPDTAPKDQQEIYGADHGYNWKLNDTVGATMIYVSITQAWATAQQSALKIFAMGIGCLSVIMICILIILNRGIVGPIIRLSEIAKNISIGKNLCDSAHSDTDDEIGVLANSIDRLRISVNKLLKRSCPNQNPDEPDKE
jgi:HAMP domain-containing protein